MIVYVVTAGDYSDYGIMSVHVDLDAAHKSAWRFWDSYHAVPGYIEVFDTDTGERAKPEYIAADPQYATDAQRDTIAEREARARRDTAAREEHARQMRASQDAARELTEHAHEQDALLRAEGAGMGLMLLCDVKTDGTVAGEQRQFLPSFQEHPAEVVNIANLDSGAVRVQVLGKDFAKVIHSYGEQKAMWRARAIGLDQ